MSRGEQRSQGRKNGWLALKGEVIKLLLFEFPKETAFRVNGELL
jgi:hypothetical protein